MNKMKFTEKEKNEMDMRTTGSHCRGSKKIHSRRKHVKAEDINKMGQEEYDRELVGIGLQLIRLEMLLQNEDQRYGWIMKMNVR